MKKIALLILLSASLSAHAAYYVEEDIPVTVNDNIVKTKLPSPSEKKSVITESISVPFCAGKSATGPVALRILNEALPKLLQAQKIVVQGRPDKELHIEEERTRFLIDWLARNGVSRSRIKDDTQRTYLYSQYFTCSDSTVTFTRAVSSQSSQSYDTEEAPQAVKATSIYYPPVSNKPVEASVTTSNAIAISTIRRIFSMSDIGKLSKAETLRLIEDFYATKQAGNTNTDEQIVIDLVTKPTQQVQNVSPPVAVQQPVQQPSLFLATPALTRKQNWQLDKALTLKDNLDAWAKLAGWNPVTWEAANFYQVTTSSVLEGSFPDVLRQIAEGTGLNICAKKREKQIRVTDSTVSCK
ncbi:MAG: TcpQ domain-containing protein [Gallionellaceae bacterium]|jgi:hypothetical protein